MTDIHQSSGRVSDRDGVFDCQRSRIQAPQLSYLECPGTRILKPFGFCDLGALNDGRYGYSGSAFEGFWSGFWTSAWVGFDGGNTNFFTNSKDSCIVLVNINHFNPKHSSQSVWQLCSAVYPVPVGNWGLLWACNEPPAH